MLDKTALTVFQPIANAMTDLTMSKIDLRGFKNLAGLLV